MENPSDNQAFLREIREELRNNGAASAAAKIQEHLDELDNIPLNIGITGECGSGKSTFVNAFRGIDNRHERAAPTGCVETTSQVTPYTHPNYHNVTLWDLPGVGTTKFPADKYLENVGFEKFDFFFIISADRFRENDVKLAQEIQRMGKKFYFVRSKIDQDLHNAERSQREFNADSTLAQIRGNCIQGLQEQGIESLQVFLVSSFELHLYDFHQLAETLERELPALKRNALLLALPNVNRGIIEKKKEVLKTRIMFQASISALVAAAPVPGLSFAVDLAGLVIAVKRYQYTFGLDSESLQNLAISTGVPLADLKAVMTSQLAANKITKELVVKLLISTASTVAFLAAEEVCRFIPIIGIPAAMAFSFASTYRMLNMCLNMISEDAQKVFTRALMKGRLAR